MRGARLEAMNAARLARLLEEAGEDRTRWAEAICDGILDPSTGSVTKDYPDRRLAEFEIKFAQLETKFAQPETKLTRGVILTQVGGFVALAVLILLK
jgi:hypothetical protein